MFLPEAEFNYDKQDESYSNCLSMSGLTCITLVAVHCVKRQSFISRANMINNSTKGE